MLELINHGIKTGSQFGKFLGFRNRDSFIQVTLIDVINDNFELVKGFPDKTVVEDHYKAQNKNHHYNREKDAEFAGIGYGIM